MGTGSSVIRGTLDMLILRTLQLEPMHGWGIAERIEARSGALLKVQPASLYAAFHRLTRQGWIRSYWARTENGRRARFYALTRAGERQLTVETEHWRRLAAGVARLLAAES